MHEVHNCQKYDAVRYRQVGDTLVCFLGENSDGQLQDSHEALWGYECPVGGMESWQFLTLHLNVVDGGVCFWVCDLQGLGHSVP